jgi:hypothetical protein
MAAFGITNEIFETARVAAAGRQQHAYLVTQITLRAPATEEEVDSRPLEIRRRLGGRGS